MKKYDFTNVTKAWSANSGKYFCTKKYWIGTGWQTVDIEIDKETFERWELWNL
jgi:hypothetical protein